MITGDDVRSALHRAATLCADEGEKWTPPRERVYELLLTAGAPVKAYDLMPAYAEGRSAKPPTVYRALDFLEHMGLAHRIASLNAYVACGADGHAHTASFLICDCCGSADEVAPDLAQPIRETAARRGFRPRTSTLEVRGLCRRCTA